MIDEKKIEEAANLCRFEVIASMHNPYQCFEEEVDAQTDLIENSFISGAKWAINEFLKDLWHPNTEEQDKSKSDKQKCQPKAQHEFTIKGVKIMAASKKDAIKKYKHSKGK